MATFTNIAEQYEKIKRALNRQIKIVRKLGLKAPKPRSYRAGKREFHTVMDAKSFVFSGDSDRLEGSGIEFNIPKPRGGWFDPRRGKLF